jgi:hypothetical protein
MEVVAGVVAIGPGVVAPASGVGSSLPQAAAWGSSTAITSTT